MNRKGLRLSITENSGNEKALLVLFPLLRYLWYWVFGDLRPSRSEKLGGKHQNINNSVSPKNGLKAPLF